MSTTTTAQWADLEDDRAEDEELAPQAHQTTSAQPGNAKDKAPAGRARRPSGTRLAVERTLAVVRLGPHQRELLAKLLGTRDTDGDDAIARLVLASLDQSSRAGVVIDKLTEIAQAVPLEAGALATELAVGDKALLAPAWAALTALGAASSTCPSAPAKAGLAVAKAAQGLSAAALADLRDVLSALDG